MSYEFEPIKTDEKAIQEIVELLRLVFPGTKKYTEAFIRWQYLENPVGKVVGYNAYLNGQLAAHYAMIPIKAIVFGKEEKGLLSLNTATRPGHEGKKLFTTLANLSYEAATTEGFTFVVGVANANSTHGFVNKLGFRLIGSLGAKLGFGRLKYISGRAFDFELRSTENLNWRLKNPSAKYKIIGHSVFAATDKPGIEAILTQDKEQLKNNQLSLGFRPIKLWIGVDSSIDWSKGMYFNVPNSLRPSPLNFIFKDLTNKNRILEYNKVKFDAIDFDAY